MEIRAYIFVEVTHGRAKGVSPEISKIEGVASSHIVTGPHDIIVFVKATDIQKLWDNIISKIQNISGVVRTITNIVAE